MLGYERDEYVGRHIAEFHVDQPVIEDILTRLLAGEVIQSYPARLRCKDGAIKDVLIDSSAYRPDGRFRHTRCFTRDVTFEKQAQEAMARLAAVVSSSSDAIVSKTLDGVITSWNAAAEQIFGYSASEMVGQSVFQADPRGVARFRTVRPRPAAQGSSGRIFRVGADTEGWDTDLDLAERLAPP